MILKTMGADVAEQAKTGNYIGIPYSKLDCQAFVEQVLQDLSVRKPDGSVYNWRGSNSMWRNYISWRGTIAECKAKFGEIPLGAFMFLIKNDGGEKEKGYNDNLGNASHVGLYVGSTTYNGSVFSCMDSQEEKGSRPNAGVSYCKQNVFTHVGLMSMIDYGTPTPEPEPVKPGKDEALKAMDVIRAYIENT